MANGLLKILGLGKFSSDLEILCGESRNLVFAFMFFLRLGLGFLCLSSLARIFKLGSRRLGESRILPFATPNGKCNQRPS